MKRHLVIFARAPQFGRVKRRLAAAIGPVAAMRFYRQTLDRQIRTLVARSSLDGLVVRHARPCSRPPGLAPSDTCAARGKAISASA